MSEKSDDPFLFTFFNESGIISQLSNAVFESALPDGLKVSQFSVLNHLIRLGDGKTPSSLASAFQVTKGAMTNTLNRLESRNLIEVTPDPSDGRGKLVFITPKGKRVRDQSIENLAPMLVTISETFSNQEFAEILPFLQKLRAHMDQARD